MGTTPISKSRQQPLTSGSEENMSLYHESQIADISYEIYFSIPRTDLLVRGFGDTELVNEMLKNT